MRKKTILAIIASLIVIAVTASVMMLDPALMMNGNEDDTDTEDSDDSGDGSDTNDTDENDNDTDDSDVTEIVLGDTIMVDGSAITTDTSSSVYESEGDGYTLINICDAGTYSISGVGDEVQIYVNATDDDEVTLILNGAEISCSSAPAIFVHNAYDPETAGEAGVTIELAAGTTNIIDASHTDANDGAISSDISIAFDGSGTLQITADMEGIESCMHLTINDGTIVVTSDEDGINANNDGISYITINGGTVIADSSAGSDGDGIDSNGYIIINGGTVYGFSSGQNSGLDSDLGTVINGGTVFATGTMNDGVSSSSDQTYINFDLASALTKGKLVYITDSDGNCVFAFRSLGSYTSFIYSSSDLSSGSTCKVYLGGSVEGTFDEYGACSSFTVTTAGTLQTSGSNTKP